MHSTTPWCFHGQRGLRRTPTFFVPWLRCCGTAPHYPTQCFHLSPAGSTGGLHRIYGSLSRAIARSPGGMAQLGFELSTSRTVIAYFQPLSQLRHLPPPWRHGQPLPQDPDWVQPEPAPYSRARAPFPSPNPSPSASASPSHLSQPKIQPELLPARAPVQVPARCSCSQLRLDQIWGADHVSRGDLASSFKYCP